MDLAPMAVVIEALAAADAAVPRYYWCIVELNPAPVDAAGWTLQREVLVRDTLQSAQRVLNILYETSIGDEVFVIQARLVK